MTEHLKYIRYIPALSRHITVFLQSSVSISPGNFIVSITNCKDILYNPSSDMAPDFLRPANSAG
ncbi:hypothetical protein X965_10930 [Morganella sp. EGD-HP17]|nr:hypothetical protein X965_10930 [Morganella sp. EGD-HP17]